MKKLVVGLAAAAVVLACAPWGMGQVARGRIDRGIDKLITQAPYLRITERKWTAGWFRSEQQLTFEVVLPGLGGLNPISAIASADASRAAQSRGGFLHTAAAGEPPVPEAVRPRAVPPRFTIRNEVMHGPVPGLSGLGVARVQTRVVWSDEIRRKLEEVMGSAEPAVRIRTRLGFFGGGATTVDGEARTIPLERLSKAGRKGAISWDDFHFKVGYSRGADHVDFDGRVPRFEVTGETAGEQVLLSDITASGSSDRIVGDLYGGDASFGIGRMRVAVARTPPMEVEQILYRAGTKHADGFMDMALQFGSGAIRSEALQSSGIEISEVHYDFTLRHLHIETLDKLMTAMRAMTQSGFEAGEPAPEAVLEPFRQHGVALLQHAPEFALDRIGIVTPQGEGVVKGVLRLEGLTEEDLAAGILGILPRIVADIRIEVAQGLVDKLPNGATMAGAGVDSGFVKREGDKLVSHIEYRAGELKVNGKPQRVPLPGGLAPEPVPMPEDLPADELPEPLVN